MTCARHPGIIDALAAARDQLSVLADFVLLHHETTAPPGNHPASTTVTENGSVNCG
jgi:hypothetical protein